MTKLQQHQSGFSIIEALLLVVIVAILGFTGYFVYHSQKSTNKTLNETNKAGQSSQTAISSGPERYVSFGKNSVSIAAPADVAKLTGAGSTLKKYFTDNVGKPVNTLDGSATPQTFSVTALYGNYALGSGNYYAGAPVIWGPKTGGSVGVLISSQDLWECKSLSALHIPAKLLTGSQCADANGQAMTYKG